MIHGKLPNNEENTCMIRHDQEDDPKWDLSHCIVHLFSQTFTDTTFNPSFTAIGQRSYPFLVCNTHTKYYITLSTNKFCSISLPLPTLSRLTTRHLLATQRKHDDPHIYTYLPPHDHKKIWCSILKGKICYLTISNLTINNKCGKNQKYFWPFLLIKLSEKTTTTSTCTLDSSRTL